MSEHVSLKGEKTRCLHVLLCGIAAPDREAAVDLDELAAIFFWYRKEDYVRGSRKTALRRLLSKLDVLSAWQINEEPTDSGILTVRRGDAISMAPRKEPSLTLVTQPLDLWR